MKKYMVLCLLFLSLHGFAQDNKDAKVEQYCEVVATPKLLSNKVTIEVDYGEVKSFWKNNRLKDEDGKLKKFNSVIDALNYMGKMNWKLVNAFPISNGSNQFIYHYVFRKEFPKAETEE